MHHYLPVLSLTFFFLLSGCGGGASSSSNPVISESGNHSSDTSVASSEGTSSAPSTYVYQGTAMVSPFKAYNQDGTLIKQYSNVYYAIQKASDEGLTSNKTYVLDGANTKVFERTNRNNYYCYDGPNFVGIKPSAEALEWGATRSRCFCINGLGNSMNYLGREDMAGNEPTNTAQLELASGAYNYLYSKEGVYSESDPIAGYAYSRCIVRLSEAHYLPSKDGFGWNAYAFLNVAGMGVSMDMGLIGNLDESDNTVHWRPGKNCMATELHTSGDAFMTYPDHLMTQSVWNEKSQDYTGADDILIEAWADKDGFEFNVKNLRTGALFNHRENHPGINDKALPYYRVLLAASYCPVQVPIWNGDCGAKLDNVIFDQVEIARYREDGDYSAAEMFDFYPGEECVSHGYSQGAYWASHTSGSYHQDGKYASGLSYQKGQKFVTFNVAYDGSAHAQS